MLKKHLLLLLLISGLIFRIAISFNTYSGDVTNHMIWGEDAVKHGLPGYYERNFEKLYGHTSPNYPPLAILFFSFLYLIKEWIYQFAWFLNFHISFFPSNFIYFLKDFDYYPYLLKFPAIFSDIGIACITYLFAQKIVGKKKTKWPVIALLLVLFNPAYFYNSAYWGQTDSIPLFFLLTSFFLLIYRGKILTSTVLFTLGILSKQTVVIFIPLYLIILYRLISLKTLVKIFLVSLLVFWLFFLPFFRQGNLLTYPFTTYLNKILLSPGIPFTSNHAFNIWYLLTGSRLTLASSKFILNISHTMWGYLVTGFLSLLILFKLFRHSGEQSESRIVVVKNILYAGFLIPLASFLFLTKMHERHLILALPFLLLLTYNNKFLLVSYLFLSLFNFLNMYHNWWFPNIQILMFFLSSPLTIIFLTYTLIGVFILMLKNYFFIRNKQIKQI
ncbi:hypothetical protein A2767_06785 [Candidatus Roizmanbacteria bacterium RIFCSPHIGHO2_01_FULL_35_10]|uniref:Glycosyltransferase RgtA/B/C/D-like domain-containing protein n=1 Tax=Candidatus Roizmanbacteria bacterium RIFCSPLOWO2_01_FULL_35_13 TaxID=1802055 RepID=A0A1F7I7J7_9BACT|nr:MAG: hypothetical protein A2767_06785 [Candidatus Roizmanbacteria bacterium RIFCSPHIGHO2_01_FULL_35_10]OGK39338.1 MAG: hypothetical protein A3A74_05205 [Candidatus Roizmanbacteria bacterium RIFCSPLOWO2_01_FULL_35_13]